MIFGLGTDIVEVARIQDKLSNNPALIQHIFSEDEQAYCQKQKHPYVSFAARFAVKEAFLKAFGVQFIGNHSLPEIAVHNTEYGKPSIILSGKAMQAFTDKNLQQIQVSISHTLTHAIAVVIIE
jgi:holo-[acyl-carrier protein] synthase